MTGFPIVRILAAEKSVTILIALGAVVTVSALPLFCMLEPHLVLPALSMLFFAGAAGAAIVAISARMRKNTEVINLWDVAGGLVLIGIAASVLGEPEYAAQLFEHLFEHGPKMP